MALGKPVQLGALIEISQVYCCSTKERHSLRIRLSQIEHEACLFMPLRCRSRHNCKNCYKPFLIVQEIESTLSQRTCARPNQVSPDPWAFGTGRFPKFLGVRCDLGRAYSELAQQTDKCAKPDAWLRLPDLDLVERRRGSVLQS